MTTHDKELAAYRAARADGRGEAERAVDGAVEAIMEPDRRVYNALRRARMDLTTDAARRAVCHVYGEADWAETVRLLDEAMVLTRNGGVG